LTPLWLLTGAAFLVAVGAWLHARRAVKRLERLTESYWDLRYEYGQLRARVSRLEPPTADAEPAPAPRQANAATFVPLSSLKR
jgi:hypothetical protein